MQANIRVYFFNSFSDGAAIILTVDVYKTDHLQWHFLCPSLNNLQRSPSSGKKNYQNNH
jgi:hypothetical protein